MHELRTPLPHGAQTRDESGGVESPRRAAPRMRLRGVRHGIQLAPVQVKAWRL